MPKKHLSLRGLLTLTSLPALGGACALSSACGSGDSAPLTAAEAVPPGGANVLPHVPGNPGVGAHGLAFYRISTHASTLSTPAMTTHASGSTMIVSVGRGDVSAHDLPRDNKGNAPYTQLGGPHTYTMWTSSGTALYAFPSLLGGAGHVVTVSAPTRDEVTLAAVEVVDGIVVKDVKWNEVLAGNPLTSLSVTTTGPATLIAFWWGDAGVRDDKTAVPNNGFTVVDSILLSGELVQCAVAVREVSAAGRYDVTWTATPTQGAQLWLVAVQQR
jgi:hypothetical protein